MGESKKLPAQMRARIRDALLAEIARRHPHGQPSQRAIALEAGLAQPVLNDILRGGGSVGVLALLAVRSYTGRTLDDLLGLPPPRAAQGDELKVAARAALDALRGVLDEAPAPRLRTPETRATKPRQ